MGYIVIFKHLAGILNVAVLVQPMVQVQHGCKHVLICVLLKRDSGMSHLGTRRNLLLCTVLHQYCNAEEKDIEL